MGTVLTVVVFVAVFAVVIGWIARGRAQRRPAPGPTMPDLSVATEVQRLGMLRDEGKITDAEYRAAKSKLLS